MGGRQSDQIPGQHLAHDTITSMSMSLDQVTTHHDVPTTTVEHHTLFNPAPEAGVTKYQAPLGNGANLKALLVNKNTDTLIVCLHGATTRDKQLPRFEWLRTFRKLDYSSLYFSDPCLELDEKVELAWYTGWKDLDLYPIIAEWVEQTARAIGATKILIFGSSGGGLAALQISTCLPGSMAFPHSCQTSISNYKVLGTRYSAQRSYLRAVMPHLKPKAQLHELPEDFDWAEPMGDRLSAIKRYQNAQPNYVYYLQNKHDYTHMEQHYEPFREAVESSPNKDRVKFVLYDGPENHNPPTQPVLHEHLGYALDWLNSL